MSLDCSRNELRPYVPSVHKLQLSIKLPPGVLQNITNLERSLSAHFFFSEINEIENGETLPEGVDADDGEPKKKGDRAQIGVFTHPSFCPSLSL